MATITTPQPQQGITPRKLPVWVWALLAVIAISAVAVVAVDIGRSTAPGSETAVAGDWSGPYYWEGITQEALTRTAAAAAADTSYVDGLERRAGAVVAERLVAAGGPTGYYWEDINRQALERTAPAITPAEQILEDLSG